ncbi:MAG TPA: FG-GAP-like repeat-containing protein, partial [Leptospiraceae bacterium]|nr:FG-GAP-like repeat-containing protein [Leptospiraceae bacterium]
MKKSIRKAFSILAVLTVSVLSLNFGVGVLDGGLPQPLPKVSADASGNAVFSFPIEVFPGTKGVDPELGASYSSAAGDGDFGAGWNLSGIGRITRSPAGMKYTADDAFISSVSGKLVRTGTSPNGFYYRNDPDAHFIYEYNVNTNSWSAKDSAGNLYLFNEVSYFGSSVKSWFLTEFRDSSGNSWKVSYSDRSRLDEDDVRISSIVYADRTVTFTYADSSLYSTLFTYGNAERDRSLISSIKAEGGGRYREYTFTYETGEFGKERLKKIGRKENTGNGEAVFRDIEFSYNADRTLDMEQQRDYRINNTYAFSQIPFQDKTQCVSGELACQQAGVSCAPGASYPACASTKAQNAAKCTTYKQRWQAVCWFGLPSPNHTLQSGDIEGDGKPELLRIVGGEKQNNLTITAIRNLDGTMTEETVSPQFGGLAYRGFNTMSFGDADGDGRVDFAYSNSDSLQIMYGNGTGFSAPVTASTSGGQSVKVPLPAPLYFTDVPDTGWKGGFVDINGDGKTDYVRVIDADKIGIFISKGRTFSPEIVSDIKGVFIAEGTAQQPPMFLDMDGDGKPELVYLTQSFCTVKKFNSDYTGIVNGSALAYGAVPDFGDPRNRFISDLNGDGKPDIIAVRDATYDVFYFTGYDFVKKVYNKPASVKRAVDDPFSAGYVNLSKSFADVNGDGHPDLINFDGTEIQVFLYSRVSMGFEDNPVLRKSASSFLYAMDVNRDGRADLISLKADKDSLLQNTPIYGTAVSFKAKRMEMKSERLSREAANAAGLVTASGYLSILTMNPFIIAGAAINSYIATQKAIRAMDRADLFSFLKFILDSLIVPEGSTLSVTSFTPQKKGNLLIGTSDGYRRSETVEYGETKDMPGTYLAGSGNGQILPNPSNSTLAVKIITNYGDGSSDYDAFDYQDARILTGLPEERADLGWRKVTVSSFPEGTRTETLNFQSSRDLAGKTERHTEFNSAGQISSDMSVQYVTGLTGAGTRFTVPSSRTEQKFRNGSLFRTVNSSVSYDAYGNPTGTVISSDGHTEETSAAYINDWTFDTYIEGLPETSVKKINGAVQEEKSFTYDSMRRPVSVTLFPSSSPRTVSTSYDSKGQPSLITDVLGYTVSHIYGQSAGNCLSESKNPLGHVSRTVCNEENGTEVQMTDPNGAVTQKLYDEYGRPVGTILPGNSQTSEETSYEFTQSPFGHVVRKRVRDDVNGWIESAEFFDAKGRSIRKESPGIGGMKFVELTEYDSAGRTARKSDSFLEGSESPLWSVYSYNADNETVSVSLPDGGRADSSISLSGSNVISSSTVYSPSGVQIRFTETETDAHGKTVRKTVDGKTVNYAYDALGRMTEISDPANGKTSISYDIFGNRTGQTDKNSGTVSYQYDTAGRMTGQTDARGMKVSFDYDALGRVTAQRGSDGTKTEYVYDETLKGKVSRVTDTTGTADYSYDIRGNSIQRVKKIDEYILVFRNEYDSLSRVTNMTYPDGTKANYRYSPDGQLSEITMDAADGTSHGNTVVSYEQRADQGSGIQLMRKAGNGVMTSVGYDRIYRRPASLQTSLSSGHMEKSLNYSYDEKGNMTELTDSIISNRTQK